MWRRILQTKYPPKHCWIAVREQAFNYISVTPIAFDPLIYLALNDIFRSNKVHFSISSLVKNIRNGYNTLKTDSAANHASGCSKYTCTTFCVCCRNDVVVSWAPWVNATINHNNQSQQQHSNMNTDRTEITTSLTNIDGDLAHDNGAPSGMKPSKKSQVSWPKMPAVKTNATGRSKHLYLVLTDKSNQKDTRLVVLLLELAPYEAKHGTKQGAWNSFLRTIQDEVDKDGDFIFPSISKNAFKSRFDGYISFVKLHRSISKGNMGFDKKSPSALLAKLYEFEAK
jgi:hypothetical protein